MSATIPLLIYAATLAPGFAPQRSAQEGQRTRASAVATPRTRTALRAGVPIDLAPRELDEVATAPQPVMAFPTCSLTIKDVTSGDCIAADSTPTLGRLYPLSPAFNIDGAGNVGIGTTTQTARLHVRGTATITNTLTLAPAGDLALDVSSGSIYKAGALFIHTKGGSRNTALGQEALSNTIVGSDTAVGYRALYSNTAGIYNTAIGDLALYRNTIGSWNTAVGSRTLLLNTSGYRNTGVGYFALYANTTGADNTACGAQALSSNTSGSRNTATGNKSLLLNSTGVNNTAHGAFALATNTTGNGNTAVGGGALSFNSVGFQNTAAGWLTLYNNTDGDGNAAHGALALSSNTSGSYNTASGERALFLNTTASNNTAIGSQALLLNTTGDFNVASGRGALRNNTTGSHNAAGGGNSLFSNTTGYQNTASGYRALFSNTTGFRNTAIGRRALHTNVTGLRNTAVGSQALEGATGSSNIAIGYNGGFNLTSGNNNIAIGSGGVAGEGATTRIGSGQTRAFIAGIRAVTTGMANAIPVLIDGNGQLGTVSSSRRFKQDVEDMGAATERLLELRPVVFRYTRHVESYGDAAPTEYGLIAEEVAEVFPELVVYDGEGEPFTVKYHLLSSMLLNELQQHDEELEELRARLVALEASAVSATSPSQER